MTESEKYSLTKVKAQLMREEPVAVFRQLEAAWATPDHLNSYVATLIRMEVRDREIRGLW